MIDMTCPSGLNVTFYPDSPLYDLDALNAELPTYCRGECGDNGIYAVGGDLWKNNDPNSEGQIT